MFFDVYDVVRVSIFFRFDVFRLAVYVVYGFLDVPRTWGVVPFFIFIGFVY